MHHPLTALVYLQCFSGLISFHIYISETCFCLPTVFLFSAVFCFLELVLPSFFFLLFHFLLLSVKAGIINGSNFVIVDYFLLFLLL